MNNSKTTQIKVVNSNKQIPSPGITKYATLSPYLVQIEKRKKTKSVLRQNRAKSKNQSSSKSFRIKQRSTSSLHSQNKQDLNNKTIISIISKFNAKKKQQNSRNKRVISDRQKPYIPTSVFTSKTNASRTISRNDAIDIRQKRTTNELSFRRNKYQSKSRNQVTNSRDQNKQTIQISKYGYTDTSRTQKQGDTIVPQKQTQNMYGVVNNKKNKFRRGKYEALYSSVNSNDVNQQKDKNSEPTKSQSRFQFTKKQSNLNIAKDVEQLQDKQMQQFYRQIRSREIEKSLEKSTQKYFKQQKKYRLPKTNNDIQSNNGIYLVYVSTIKDPSINRQSNASTLNTSQKQVSYVSSIQKPKTNNYLNYDFDFKQIENNISGITEIDNPSEQQSMQYQQQSSFDRQRKQVQKQYFHKKTTPKMDWSEQDCQIDDV